MKVHPTIERMKYAVTKGDEIAILDILAEDVQFQPPTYFKPGPGACLLPQFWDMLDMYFQISNTAE